MVLGEGKVNLIQQSNMSFPESTSHMHIVNKVLVSEKRLLLHPVLVSFHGEVFTISVGCWLMRTCTYMHLSTHPSIHLSSTPPSTHSSTHPSILLSTHSSTCPPSLPSIHPSIHPSSIHFVYCPYNTMYTSREWGLSSLL